MKERVIKEFRELRRKDSTRLRTRVIQPGEQSELYLDIRDFVESPTFTGWTRRGIRLTVAELDVLVGLMPAIRETLMMNRTESTDPKAG